MSTEIVEVGSVTGTQFFGSCEACGERGRTYQVTGENGHVALCPGCWETMGLAIANADQDAQREKDRRSEPGVHPRCSCKSSVATVAGQPNPTGRDEFCPIHGQDIR